MVVDDDLRGQDDGGDLCRVFDYRHGAEACRSGTTTCPVPAQNRARRSASSRRRSRTSAPEG
jgi:hypothetical protein